MNPLPNRARVSLGAALLLLLPGCATHLADLVPVQDALVAGDTPAAMERFEQVKGSRKDLLYLLEKGYLNHLSGRWEESNRWFEAAERRADELYTRSLSREAAALLTSDLALPYRGTPCELQLIHYYRALNYLALNLPDDALVEARKANYVLAGDEAGKGSRTTPRHNAFLQYVTGLVYESQGELNDAAVSLRDAARLYRTYAAEFGSPVPTWLDEDYYAAARHLGLDAEADSLAALDPEIPRGAREHDRNNLVIFLESGFVPRRAPVDITLPVMEARHGKDDDSDATAGLYLDRYGGDIYAWRADRVSLDHVLRFSFPELVDVPSRVERAEVLLPSGEIIAAEPALDLRPVAHAEFESRLPGTLLRTVIRALAKETGRKEARKEGKVLGWLVNAINVVTEQADTRGWIFLPARIDLVKTSVPEGTNHLVVRFRDAQGGVVEEGALDVEILPGRIGFVSVRTFR